MSYEPRLIINKNALNHKANEIEQKHWENPDDKALQYVHSLLIVKGVRFIDKLIILAQPELTSFNAEVRDVLFEFDIDYAEWN